MSQLKNIKFIIGMLIVNVLCSCAVNHNNEIGKIREPVFRIFRDNETLGTGFLYSYRNSVYVLTARHVFNLKKQSVIADSKTKLEGENYVSMIEKVECPIKTTDICIVFPKMNISNRSFLTGSDDYVDAMLNVYSLHYSQFPPRFSSEMLFSKGYSVRRLSDTEVAMHIDMVEKGASGAPVLNENTSKVVGMIVSVMKTSNEVNQGIVYVLPINTINSFLDNYINIGK